MRSFCSEFLVCDALWYYVVCCGMWYRVVLRCGVLWCTPYHDTTSLPMLPSTSCSKLTCRRVTPKRSGFVNSEGLDFSKDVSGWGWGGGASLPGGIHCPKNPSPHQKWVEGGKHCKRWGSGADGHLSSRLEVKHCTRQVPEAHSNEQTVRSK